MQTGLIGGPPDPEETGPEADAGDVRGGIVAELVAAWVLGEDRAIEVPTAAEKRVARAVAQRLLGAQLAKLESRQAEIRRQLGFDPRAPDDLSGLGEPPQA